MECAGPQSIGQPLAAGVHLSGCSPAGLLTHDVFQGHARVCHSQRLGKSHQFLAGGPPTGSGEPADGRCPAMETVAAAHAPLPSPARSDVLRGIGPRIVPVLSHRNTAHFHRWQWADGPQSATGIWPDRSAPDGSRILDLARTVRARTTRHRAAGGGADDGHERDVLHDVRQRG